MGEVVQAQARVEAVFVTGQGSAPMRRVDELKALAGEGFEGDRYRDGTGYWSRTDECQVTFIESEHLATIAQEGLDVGEGQHRRNVVTSGVRLRDLTGRRWKIGDAVFAYDRPRPPCAHVQQLTQPGMTRALAGARGGICATVETPGAIRPGDRIELLDT